MKEIDELTREGKADLKSFETLLDKDGWTDSQTLHYTDKDELKMIRSTTRNELVALSVE